MTSYSPDADACYTANGDTHCAYCMSQMVRSDGNLDCKFHHGAPTKFTIDAGSGNTTYTVCSQYMVPGSSPVYSAIGAP